MPRTGTCAQTEAAVEDHQGFCWCCGHKKFRLAVYGDRWFPWCNRCGQEWTPADREQGQDVPSDQTVAEVKDVRTHVVSSAGGSQGQMSWGNPSRGGVESRHTGLKPEGAPADPSDVIPQERSGARRHQDQSRAASSVVVGNDLSGRIAGVATSPRGSTDRGNKTDRKAYMRAYMAKRRRRAEGKA